MKQFLDKYIRRLKKEKKQEDLNKKNHKENLMY